MDDAEIKALAAEWKTADRDELQAIYDLLGIAGNMSALEAIEQLQAALAPLEAAMDDDWAYILSLPGDGGRGRFWKEFLRGLRAFHEQTRDQK